MNELKVVITPFDTVPSLFKINTIKNSHSSLAGRIFAHVKGFELRANHFMRG